MSKYWHMTRIWWELILLNIEVKKTLKYMSKLDYCLKKHIQAMRYADER